MLMTVIRTKPVDGYRKRELVSFLIGNSVLGHWFMASE